VTPDPSPTIGGHHRARSPGTGAEYRLRTLLDSLFICGPAAAPLVEAA
jgi:hypothetical protein